MNEQNMIDMKFLYKLKNTVKFLLMWSLYRNNISVLEDSKLFKTIYYKADSSILFITEKNINFLLQLTCENLWAPVPLDEDPYDEYEVEDIHNRCPHLYPPYGVYRNWHLSMWAYSCLCTKRKSIRKYFEYLTIALSVGDLELPIDFYSPFSKETMEEHFLSEYIPHSKECYYMSPVRRYNIEERYKHTLKLLLINALIEEDLRLFLGSPLILESLTLSDKLYVLTIQKKWFSFSLDEIENFLEKLTIKNNAFVSLFLAMKDSIYIYEDKVEHISNIGLDFDYQLNKYKDLHVNDVIEKFLPYGSIEGQRIWFFFDPDNTKFKRIHTVPNPAD